MNQAAEQAALAYQRALAALHDVREELAAVRAAGNRLGFDRAGLAPEEVRSREAALAARREQLLARETELRQQAERLRGARSPAGEPDGIASGELGDGFEQPPFARELP